MSRFKTIDDVITFLNSIPMFQKAGVSSINYSLDNIRTFCEELGNPQLQYPVIHIAGTNGKGTTCYILERIYQNIGVKTGVFTSPHLLRYNERVRVGGKEIPDEDLLNFFQATDELLTKIRLSYFEISTALAFWYFAKQKVDLAIIEVGLGGRLDSTNIVDPEVSVITSIGFDHQNMLGNKIEEIAFEKAGIIKPGKPVVIGNVDGEALEVIESIADRKNSEVVYARDLKPLWKPGFIIFEELKITMQSSLKESVNKWNVACAWQVCEVLTFLYPVSEKDFTQCINAFNGAPGRFEKLHTKYEWYFSGSHNIQSLDASLKAIRQLKKMEDTVLVFSSMKDKLSTEIFLKLKPFKNIYFVEQKGERAAKFKEVKDELGVTLMDENNAQIILKELQTELVIFAGSFYFYPIVRRWISKVP